MQNQQDKNQIDLENADDSQIQQDGQYLGDQPAGQEDLKQSF